MYTYEMVAAWLRREIRKKSLSQGDRMPSVRDVARILKVNKITVVRAYRNLEESHEVYAIPRGGYYVVAQEELPEGIGAVIDFQRMLPEPRLLPSSEFLHAINRAVREYGKNIFNYGNPKGFPPLIETLQEYFMQKNVYAREREIFVTNGAQQGISLLLDMFFSDGDGALLIEEPTYNLVQNFAIRKRIPCFTVKRDSKGLDLHSLEFILRRENIKLFYIMPRFHNPLGTSLSEAAKKRIVELAHAYGAYILEDDYLGDLETDSGVLPLHYYDVHGRVIYLRSFSKTFMPGIRLGSVVVPGNLVFSFAEQRYLYDLGTSMLPQGALHIFIKSGMYDHHVKKIVAVCGEKMSLARSLVEKMSPPGMPWIVADKGITLWLELPSSGDPEKIRSFLKEKGVAVSVTGDSSSEAVSGLKGVKICLMGVGNEEIRKGLLLFFREIKHLI